MNPILALRDVVVVRDGRTILDDISWSVDSDQRWVVLGRNGCGKTTIVQLASLYLHPTSGAVEVLGQTLGRMDVRAMRRRIGLASAALSNQLRPQLRAADVVVTAVEVLPAVLHGLCVLEDPDRPAGPSDSIA